MRPNTVNPIQGHKRLSSKLMPSAETMAIEHLCGARGLRLTQGGSPGYQRLADEDPQLRNDPAAQ